MDTKLGDALKEHLHRAVHKYILLCESAFAASFPPLPRAVLEQFEEVRVCPVFDR